MLVFYVRVPYVIWKQAGFTDNTILYVFSLTNTYNFP